MRDRVLAVAAVVVLAATGCITVQVGFGAMGASGLREVVVERSPRWMERSRVAIVDVDGFIGAEAGLTWLLGGTTVADVRERLSLAAADPRVRAVVLRVNSPGGEAAASDMVHHDLRAFRRETGKPVVAALLGTAASGGYYASLAADRIVASPSTVTGSVGVLLHLVNATDLYGKIGVRPVVIKSGERKDMGSPARAMTDEERDMLQGVIDGLFAQFRRALVEGRPAMTQGDLAAATDGRVVTARQALELHMVDAVGYLDDAIDEARRLAGIETSDVILYRAHGGGNANVYARGGLAPALLSGTLAPLLRGGGLMLYLWEPGL